MDLPQNLQKVWESSRNEFASQARERNVSTAQYTVALLLMALVVLAFFLVPQIPGSTILPPPLKALVFVFLSGIGLFIGSILLGEKRLSRIVFYLDRVVQRIDKFLNLNRHEAVWINLRGHSWKATALAVLFAMIVILGPHWWRSGALADWAVAAVALSAGGALLAVAVLNFFSRRFARNSWTGYSLQFLPQMLAFSLLIGLILLVTKPESRAVDSLIYIHIMLFLAGILLAMMVLAYVSARWLFRRYKIEKTEMEPLETETARNPDRLGIDYKRFGRSLIKAPVYHLIEILWLPSIVVVLVAEHDTMARWAFYMGIGGWVLYATAEMHDHLGHLLAALRRMLFLGGQLVVSLVVILLAAGRLFDNSYIATIVEGEGFFIFSNLTLLGYILSAYLVFWYYEYWTNRILCDRLLSMFATAAASEVGRIRVAYKDSESSESRDGGVLQVHGGSRFALLDENKKFLESFGRINLINQLLKDGPRTGTELDGGQLKLVLIGRLRFYFTILGLFLVAVIAGAAFSYKALPQRAEVETTAAAPDQAGLFDLRQALFGGTNGSDDEKCAPGAGNDAILVAASGGGTRAALYTYSVLRGLRQVEMDDGCTALHRVVLLSGVSGGSAALAYFRINRQDLLETPPGNDPANPWSLFGAAMSHAFIQDVLLGASEMRMLYGCTREKSREGIRLGSLLRESMDRRFNANLFDNGCSPIHTAGRKDDGRYLTGSLEIGLIFNTTLGGLFPIPGAGNEEPENGCPVRLADTPIISVQEDALEAKCRTSVGKGGRLVMTNLDKAPALFAPPEHRLTAAPASYLNYEIIDDPRVPVATAAALSANFPPVFPNAAVDRKGVARYWVTDGGAADNRGIVSLLYALERTIESQRNQGSIKAGTPWPNIHVILADASATNLAYAQDRGVSSALGAAERFASQLMTDKLDKINNDYKALTGDPGKRIEFHNLTMPVVLRSDGGVGTHWMLPEQISMRTPFGKVLRNKDGEVVTLEQLAEPCDADSGDLDFLGTLGRFFGLTRPGCNLDRQQVVTLFEMLHTTGNADAFKPLTDIAGEKPNILRWLCEMPLLRKNNHAENWTDLVSALGGGSEHINYCTL